MATPSSENLTRRAPPAGLPLETWASFGLKSAQEKLAAQQSTNNQQQGQEAGQTGSLTIQNG